MRTTWHAVKGESEQTLCGLRRESVQTMDAASPAWLMVQSIGCVIPVPFALGDDNGETTDFCSACMKGDQS